MIPEEIIKLIDAEADVVLKKVRIKKIYGIVVVRMAQSTFDKAQFPAPDTNKRGACIRWGGFSELPDAMGNGLLIRERAGSISPTLCLSLTNIWPIVIDPDINHGKAMISVWDVRGGKYVPEE